MRERKYYSNRMLGPTELTWEERNPSAYLFNKKALDVLQETVEKKRTEKKGRHSLINQGGKK